MTTCSFVSDIKLPGNLEFGAKPAAERDATYIRKEESLYGLHEFVRTRTKMVTDKMKARCDRAAKRKK